MSLAWLVVNGCFWYSAPKLVVVSGSEQEWLPKLEGVEWAGGIEHGLVHLAGSPSGGRRRVDTAVPAPVHHRLLLEVVIRINLARLRLLVLVVADASSRGCLMMYPPSWAFRTAACVMHARTCRIRISMLMLCICLHCSAVLIMRPPF